MVELHWIGKKIMPTNDLPHHHNEWEQPKEIDGRDLSIRDIESEITGRVTFSIRSSLNLVMRLVPESEQKQEAVRLIEIAIKLCVEAIQNAKNNN